MCHGVLAGRHLFTFLNLFVDLQDEGGNVLKQGKPWKSVIKHCVGPDFSK